jgi:hypothetical protein
MGVSKTGYAYNFTLNRPGYVFGNEITKLVLRIFA